MLQRFSCNQPSSGGIPFSWLRKTNYSRNVAALYNTLATMTWHCIVLTIHVYYASTCIITVIFTPKKNSQNSALSRERWLIFLNPRWSLIIQCEYDVESVGLGQFQNDCLNGYITWLTHKFYTTWFILLVWRLTRYAWVLPILLRLLKLAVVLPKFETTQRPKCKIVFIPSFLPSFLKKDYSMITLSCNKLLEGF